MSASIPPTPIRIDPLHTPSCDYLECEAVATWLVGELYTCDDHKDLPA